MSDDLVQRLRDGFSGGGVYVHLGVMGEAADRIDADTALLRQALAALECSTDYDTSAAQARVIAALRARLEGAA